MKKINVMYGLVLAGGKSTRMGRDKGMIRWHKSQQRYFLADLLMKYCSKTFISCRSDQEKTINSSYKTIIDSYKDLGQYGAILSALSKYPKKSFLVIACDMPLADNYSVEYLIKMRDKKMIVTSYKSGINELPEPLFAIWEARSKKRLLELLDQGITCPRKALIKTSQKVKLISPFFPELTMNINTPGDARKMRRILKERNFNNE